MKKMDHLTQLYFNYLKNNLNPIWINLFITNALYITILVIKSIQNIYPTVTYFCTDSSNNVQVFPKVLKRWSTLLKTLYNEDVDEKVKLHAQQALIELDRMKKDILTSYRNAPIQKKIEILPSNF